MKNKQRNQLLLKRGALNRSRVYKNSYIVSRKINEFINRGSFRFIASYCPYRNEINPNLFLNYSRLYFPKVLNSDIADMSFFKGTLVKSFKGIKEPKVFKRKVFKKFLDIVIVPGVGFDERGFRIGYGKGFYDRFLKNLKALKVGVTHDCCVIDRVCETDEDVPVDLVITEKRKILCRLRR